MKLLAIATLSAALLAFLPAPAAGDARPLRLFILAGQSNMEGADAHAREIDALPHFVGAGEPQKDVRYRYMHGPEREENGALEWIPLQPDRRDGKFGPELTFAREVKEHTAGPIAIVKSAWGGTTLAKDWDPDDPSDKKLYARLLRMVGDATKDLERGGREVELAGFLWHQGENDMLDHELMTGYGERLERLISRVRKDLQAPELPFFIGEISDKGIWGLDHRRNMQVVRKQQRAVCAKTAHVHWVETSHLAFKVTREGHPHYHFGTEGQLQHGVAYARAYLASIGVDLPLPLSPYSVRPPLKSGAKVRVFIVAGQRSAEGDAAYVKELEALRGGRALAKPRKGVPFRYRLGGGALTSPDWCPLAPANLHGTFGPELSLGARLDEKLEDPVAILKLTHSAAMLEDWLPDFEHPSRPQYADAVRFVRAALQDLRKKGLRPSLEALFWISGEHDAWWPTFRRDYAKNLSTLITALRRDLKAPRLHVLLAEPSDHTRWGADRLEAMDAQLVEAAGADPRTHFVDTDTLPVEDGAITFGTRGMVSLGHALADAWLQLTKVR